MSDEDQDSIERDEIIKKIITHRFPNKSRPNSQLFPKTPDIRNKDLLKSLNPSKKSSPLASPKPGNKHFAFTPSNISALSKHTSHEIIRSIYLLVSSKFPINLCASSELDTKDQEEIHEFFLRQKEKFKKTLQDLAEKSRAKKSFSGKTNYSKVTGDKYLSEIKRIKEKQNLVKKELVRKTSERILREKMREKKSNEIESKKKKNEEKKMQNIEKKLILKNIENYYRDKASLVKEYFKDEQERIRVLMLEKKQMESEKIKEIKMSSSKKFSDLKDKYEMEIERLKEKFNNMH